jgi:hypothetical protein
MKKLAIVGSHPGTRGNAPWDDNNFDIWVFNEAAQSKWCKRVTGVFQLHVPEIYTNLNNMSNQEHWPWLQSEHDFTIWMQEKDARVPASERFPKDKIIDRLLSGFMVGGKIPKYLTSTPAMAIAHAIYLGYKHIKLFGYEMDSNTEYAYQREGVLFWMGEAHGRGVLLEAECMEGIFHCPVYGYEGIVEHSPDVFRAHMVELREQIETLKKEVKPINFDGDVIKQIEELDQITYQIGNAEGRHFTVARYEAKTRKMTRPILSRSEFEMSGAYQKETIQDSGALAARSLGWIDAALSVHNQVKSEESLQSLKEHINAHISFKHKNAYAMGIFEENMELQREYDKMLLAAGGEKSLAAFQGE